MHDPQIEILKRQRNIPSLVLPEYNSSPIYAHFRNQAPHHANQICNRAINVPRYSKQSVSCLKTGSHYLKSEHRGRETQKMSEASEFRRGSEYVKELERKVQWQANLLKDCEIQIKTMKQNYQALLQCSQFEQPQIITSLARNSSTLNALSGRQRQLSQNVEVSNIPVLQDTGNQLTGNRSSSYKAHKNARRSSSTHQINNQRHAFNNAGTYSDLIAHKTHNVKSQSQFKQNYELIDKYKRNSVVTNRKKYIDMGKQIAEVNVGIPPQWQEKVAQRLQQMGCKHGKFTTKSSKGIGNRTKSVHRLLASNI